uniref:Uncharacterized protein n=1 Tax=Magallana gigas TaxID=29159 RepID=K1R6R5_MAGGI
MSNISPTSRFTFKANPVKPEKAKTKKEMIANIKDTCDRKEEGPREEKSSDKN